MAYDSYGDKISETNKKLEGKKLKSTIIINVILFLITVLNIVVICLPFNGFIAFVFVPFFMLVYVNLLKGISTLKDDGYNMKLFDVLKIFQPIVYLITAVLCFFK